MASIHQHSFSEDVKKQNRLRDRQNIGIVEPLNHEQEHILKWLKQVRFKKSLFGGVNEADLWKKIAELNSLYEAALSAERARYDALLAERIRFQNSGKAGDENHG